MCKLFKPLLADVIIRIKTWSIKKQMMFCYILGILIIVTMVISVVILNTFLLQQQTVEQVERTRNSQANEDLQDLAKTGSQVIYSKIYEDLLSLKMLQSMMIDMYREVTFAPDYPPLYTFSGLDPATITQNKAHYGDNFISYQAPTIFYMRSLNLEEQVLAQKVSRFSYVLPALLEIYKSYTIRYTMYFDQSGFGYFYPGIQMDSFDPTEFLWYNQFMEIENTTITSGYSDIFGNPDNYIASEVVPLYNNVSERIGILTSDLLVANLYDLLKDLKYLKEGYQYIVYKDGSIMDPIGNPWINPKITNLSNMTFYELWQNILIKPTDINYLVEDGDIWRVASAPIVQDPNVQSEWDFVLIILARESDVMSYKEDAKVIIRDEGLKFIVITVVCSIVVSWVIICFINFQANNISVPIQGIIDFTYKLNSEENSEEVLKELNSLPEGTDQTARLVMAYKELAKSLINRKDSTLKKQDEEIEKFFPPNELHRVDRSVFSKYLDLIPYSVNHK